MTAGDLSAALESQKLGWKVRSDLHDDSPLPRHPLGGDTSGLKRVHEVPPVDWDSVAKQLPANPGVVKRRLESGMVPLELLDTAKALLPAPTSKRGIRSRAAKKTNKSKSTGKKP